MKSKLKAEAGKAHTQECLGGYGGQATMAVAPELKIPEVYPRFYTLKFPNKVRYLRLDHASSLGVMVEHSGKEDANWWHLPAQCDDCSGFEVLDRWLGRYLTPLTPLQVAELDVKDAAIAQVAEEYYGPSEGTVWSATSYVVRRGNMTDGFNKQGKPLWTDQPWTNFHDTRVRRGSWRKLKDKAEALALVQPVAAPISDTALLQVACTTIEELRKCMDELVFSFEAPMVEKMKAAFKPFDEARKRRFPAC